MWTAKDMRRSRAYTSALLDAVDEGMLNKDALIQDLLGWMSEADVENFVRSNDLLEVCGMADEESDPMDDFNYPGSRYHY